jgi:hypothetical protein
MRAVAAIEVRRDPPTHVRPGVFAWGTVGHRANSVNCASNKWPADHAQFESSRKLVIDDG